MAIPESQLETWSHQGSISQSSITYNAIRNTLSSDATPYRNRDVKIFLQGSYGNDTNIYAESDVDIVIQCNDTFHHDLADLSETEKGAFHAAHAKGEYSHAQFKSDVVDVLVDAYGNDVTVGDKAVCIAAGSFRRRADVIPALLYRRYSKFNSLGDCDYVEGICFYNKAGQLIANYPRQHSRNLTNKHQGANEWLKPMIRILKNLRSRAVDDGALKPKSAPSYYLEGLMYNVPNGKFGGSYGETMVNAINWALSTDRTQLVCANEQYYLLRDGSPVTWNEMDCATFLDVVARYWKEWE